MPEEYLPENNHELNQMCKAALRKAKQVPEETGLYWLQLVEWARESGELQLNNPDMAVFLDLLLRQKPKVVMDFLTKENPEDGEDDEVLVAEQKDWNPVDLASKILDHLDSRMSAELEDYPAPLLD